MGKPPPATDIRDVQVIKHDRAFFMSDRFGDVPEENQTALGLYYRDTRFLSKLELTLGELRPILLHSSTERNYSQIVELAFPPSWPTLRDSSTGRTSRSPGTGCWRTRSWSRSRFGTSARSSNVQLSRFLDRAILDLRMLMSEDDSAPYLDAGVPWFSGLFGRDSLLAAYECLGVNPELAWGVLRGLAARQGTEENEWRDEEPGKILHELRVGELDGDVEYPVACRPQAWSSGAPLVDAEVVWWHDGGRPGWEALHRSTPTPRVAREHRDHRDAGGDGEARPGVHVTGRRDRNPGPPQGRRDRGPDQALRGRAQL